MLKTILQRDDFNSNRIMVVKDKHATYYLPMRTFSEGLEQINWLFKMWDKYGYYWSINDTPPVRSGFGVIIRDDWADERKAYQQALNGNPLWLMDLTQDWEYQGWEIEYLNMVSNND